MASSLLVLLGLALVAETHGSFRTFKNMLREVTGKGLSHYNYYGCHCFFHEKGKILDDIDRCCHVQNCCYNGLTKQSCYPKQQPYRYTYNSGALTCDDEDTDGCGRKSCECDRAAIICIESQQYDYNNAGYRLTHKCNEAMPGC